VIPFEALAEFHPADFRRSVNKHEDHRCTARWLA
jgi:hypothetical protein